MDYELPPLPVAERLAALGHDQAWLDQWTARKTETVKLSAMQQNGNPLKRPHKGPVNSSNFRSP
jgi:hypothetical protein